MTAIKNNLNTYFFIIIFFTFNIGTWNVTLAKTDPKKTANPVAINGCPETEKELQKTLLINLLNSLATDIQETLKKMSTAELKTLSSTPSLSSIKAEHDRLSSLKEEFTETLRNKQELLRKINDYSLGLSNDKPIHDYNENKNENKEGLENSIDLLNENIKLLTEKIVNKTQEKDAVVRIYKSFLKQTNQTKLKRFQKYIQAPRTLAINNVNFNNLDCITLQNANEKIELLRVNPNELDDNKLNFILSGHTFYRFPYKDIDGLPAEKTLVNTTLQFDSNNKNEIMIGIDPNEHTLGYNYRRRKNQYHTYNDIKKLIQKHCPNFKATTEEPSTPDPQSSDSGSTGTN